MEPTGYPHEYPTEYPSKAASAPIGGIITGTTTVNESPDAINLILALQAGDYVDAQASAPDGEVYRFAFTGVAPGTYRILNPLTIFVENIVISGTETVDVGNINYNPKE